MAAAKRLWRKTSSVRKTFGARMQVTGSYIGRMASRCDLVLPARDEAVALRWLLPRVPANVGVIVVDNGSTDETKAVAEAAGATVVVEPRTGYGAAVHAGVLASQADVVAVMDADGSLEPRELPHLLDLFDRAGADLVVGRRSAVVPRAWPWHARVGNAALLWRLHQVTGVRLGDIGPVRVCRRTSLLALGIQDRRFGYPLELLVRAHRAGWVVVEADVSYRPRLAGTVSKVSGSFVGSARAAVDLLRALP